MSRALHHYQEYLRINPEVPDKKDIEIAADKVNYIPANVGAQIRATTTFGSKFVDLTILTEGGRVRR